MFFCGEGEVPADVIFEYANLANPFLVDGLTHLIGLPPISVQLMASKFKPKLKLHGGGKKIIEITINFHTLCSC